MAAEMLACLLMWDRSIDERNMKRGNTLHADKRAAIFNLTWDVQNLRVGLEVRHIYQTNGAQKTAGKRP